MAPSDGAPARNQGLGRIIVMVYAVFALSGAAGLTFEVSWSRQVGLVLGNTAPAVALVLSAYFVGLAAGQVPGTQARLLERFPCGAPLPCLPAHDAQAQQRTSALVWPRRIGLLGEGALERGERSLEISLGGGDQPAGAAHTLHCERAAEPSCMQLVRLEIGPGQVELTDGDTPVDEAVRALVPRG